MPADLSIIIPVYNRQAFVVDAVRSATVQAQRNCQVIVVDDGSIPPLGDLVASVGAPIEYVYQEHRGLAAARNIGLHRAAGEFVVFLDSDDLLSEETATIHMEHLRRHWAASCVYSRWTVINEYGAHLKSDGKDLADHVLPILLYTNIAPLHAFMFRIATVRQCGGFDECLESCEDWDLLLRLALSRHVFTYTSDAGAFYRVHSESMTSAVETMLRSSIRVIDRAFSDYRVPTEWQFLRNVAHALQHLSAAAALTEQGRANAGECLRLAFRSMTSVLKDQTTPSCIEIETARVTDDLSASRLHNCSILQSAHKRLRDSVRAWVRGGVVES